MAALHPKARGNTSSPLPPTTTPTTTPNVAAVEAGVTNPMLTRENRPVVETNDTASDPRRENSRVAGVASIVVAGADQDFQADTVEDKAPDAGAAAGASPAAAVETDPSTSRYGPTPGGSTGKGRGGEGEDCAVSDCRDEMLTSDSGTPRRVAYGQDADGLPAEKEGDDEGQAQPAPPQATFVLVAKEHLVGTWLAVFVRASMLTQVSDVRSGKASTEHSIPSLGGVGGCGGYYVYVERASRRRAKRRLAHCRRLAPTTSSRMFPGLRSKDGPLPLPLRSLGHGSV